MPLSSRWAGFKIVLAGIIIEFFPVAVAGLLAIGYMVARRASSGGSIYSPHRARTGRCGSHTPRKNGSKVEAKGMDVRWVKKKMRVRVRWVDRVLRTKDGSEVDSMIFGKRHEPCAKIGASLIIPVSIFAL